jgi:photosystem II stability/assembly factor-like uncharacterized protein
MLFVFCICCAFLLTGCKSSADQTPINTVPTPTPGPSQAVTLQHIFMLDQQNGWALTSDAHILHTTKGPAHWQDVTPAMNPEQAAIPDTLTPDFLNANYGWVADNDSGKLSIWHTYDGGNSWVQTLLDTSNQSVISLQFADTLNGWLLLNNGVKGNSEAVNVLYTVDGGETWLTLDSVDANDGDIIGHIPFSGLKTGLTFVDGSNGWLTASQSVDNKQVMQLYRSQDGGFSWQAQQIAVPVKNIGTVRSLPPTFFSTNDGIMPVEFDGQSTQSTQAGISIFTTQNGGTTWNTTPPNNDLSTAVSFADTEHGWAIGNSTHAGDVYSTTDGGKTWQLLSKPAMEINKIDQIDLLSPTTGWLLAATTNSSEQLFQTTDAGKTWTAINPTASA